MTAVLSYVNVFTRDVVDLSGFYQRVFGFPEVESVRSPIFRSLDTGLARLGFNAPEAYSLLDLSDHAETKGIKFMLSFDVDAPQEVDRLVPTAVSAGATLVKAPFKTYYNCYQAVLLDPDGNVFRVNHVLS